MSSRVSQLCIALLPALAAVGVGCSSEAVNQPPRVLSYPVEATENTVFSIDGLARATDADGDALTVISASAPAGHSAVITGKRYIRVTPMQGFSGSFTVTFVVSDGTNESTARAIVHVAPINQRPIATSATLLIIPGETTQVMLQATDPDADPLTYQILREPTHGVLRGIPPYQLYTSMPGFSGEDFFTYQVSDGKTTSEIATIQLLINVSPHVVALGDFITVGEDGAVSFALAASGGLAPLTFTVVQQPRHGTVTGTLPNLTYSPVANFNGSDQLVFSASDGRSRASEATITFNVFSVNDPPVAAARTVLATEDSSIPFSLSGSDVEGGALEFFVSAPAHGTLSGSGPAWVYAPHTNFHGTDQFTFTVRDSEFARSAPATVTIEVAPVKDPPSAGAFARTLSEDTAADLVLLGDGDGDPITAFTFSAPEHGSLSGSPPALTYTPSANYSGPDSFTYTVSTATAISAPATVSLTVSPVNDVPVATSAAVTTDEDTGIDIVLQASDVETQALTYSIASGPSDGTLTGSGDTRRYTPAANANGTRSFTFRASDGTGTSASATITIAIAPVNDPPTASDDFVATDAATPLTIDVTGNDADVEGDSFTVDDPGEPAHGSAELAEGRIIYRPEPGFVGTDEFTYTVVDSHGAASTARAHVGVGTFPVNAPLETVAQVGSSVTATDLRFTASVSGDGRYLAFTSLLPLLSGDTNGLADVYLYDRGTRALALVSATPGGGAGNAGSQHPHLSGDGRYIVFESLASNLVADDSNDVADVFRRDRVTGETIRVSVATGGGQVIGGSFDPQVSDDGRLVAFRSFAFQLVANDTNGASDIFVRDAVAGTTERVSLTVAGSEADLASAEPAIGADGRFVAFSSLATNLVPGDSNVVSDVFIRDRVAGTTRRISVTSTNGEANRRSLGPSLSSTGMFISFVSDASNLVPEVTALAQPYVRNLQAQITTAPLDTTSAISWARLSGDGRYVASFGSAGATIRDRFLGVSATPPVGSFIKRFPVLSGNGKYMLVVDSGGNIIVTPNPL